MTLCECGCGQPAPIAQVTDRRRGYVKGQPHRFRQGHGAGKWQRTGPLYVEEDRGYKTPCWIYQGAISRDTGYGLMKRGRTTRGAHVRFWEALYGPVAKGLHLDHLCRVRCCVNPDHLEPVTPAENKRRGDGVTLTADAVSEIRRLLRDGIQRAPIADRFGVSVGTISDIKLRKTWKEIP